MNIVNKLTVRHLRLNRGRTLMTILGIMLSVAMVCAVTGFVLSLRDLLMREVKENKGDYHVVFVDVTDETAGRIAANEVFSTYYTKDGDSEGLTNIYLRLKSPGRDLMDIAGGIAQTYGIENWGANHELLGLEGVFVFDNVMSTFVIIALVALVIIVTGSVIVIANAFYISASERVRQFGLLKSAGATGGQIGRSVLFEAFALAAVAIPLGLLLGFLIQALALWLTNDLLRELSAMNNDMLVFRVVFSPITVCVTIAIALFTVLISAWLPARRAAKTSPIDAIRQSHDIAIRSKQLKTSRLIQKLFGFEGTLAAKSLKRSRGKYRAAVISLAVSVVLFVSVSSFVWILNKDVEMQYGGYDFDVLVYMTGDLDTLDEMDEVIRSIPDADLLLCRRTILATEVPDGFYTERAIENGLVVPYPQLLLYPMPDAEYAKLYPMTSDGIHGVLVNTTGSLRKDRKLMEFSPYNCAPGMELTLGTGLGENELQILGSVTVDAVVNEMPASIPRTMFAGDSINIIIPESVFREFFQTHEPIMQNQTNTMYAVNAADPDAFCETALDLLDGYNREDSYVGATNVSQMTRMNRNITLIVMLFGYGFIAMLSLIAITSVVTTISTGMALRKQEFAMLYSAGMTSKGMNKMLNLESLLYGLKSLLIGLPIGVALSYLMYLAMASTMEFAYQLPWSAMLIGSAAVMLLTFGTMRYSKGKLKRTSIVEAIRNETA